MNIEIKILNKDFYKEDLPKYQTSGSAAIDLISVQNAVILPGESLLVSSGISVHINDNSVAGLVLPRSSLGIKGLVLANTIGLIDSDYQGELKIAVLNRLSSGNIEINAGDRIAQLMFLSVVKVNLKLVEEFTSLSGRGEGGFGSTGV